MNTELTEKLIADYKVIVTDAEALVKAVAGQSADKIAEARIQLQHTLLALTPRLANIEAVLKDHTRVAVSAADEYVHHNPWIAMGAATCVGVVVGLLIGRR